jgi:hypothetical protein
VKNLSAANCVALLECPGKGGAEVQYVLNADQESLGGWSRSLQPEAQLGLAIQ